MRPRIRTVVASSAVVAGSLLAGGRAEADVVHLKGGRRIVGTVEEAGDSVRIRFDGGAISVPRAQVERIEKADLPREEFEKRLASLAERDADGALALAAFAEQAGLADEAGRALAKVAVHVADDERLRRALHRWSVHLRRLPADPAGDESLRAAVGPGAHLHVSAHFRIAHDVAPERVRRHAEVLEAAYGKVYEFAERIGVAAAALDRRVDVLLFADHERWVAAVGRPAAELQGLSGVFLRATGRVLLFDTTTMPEARAARAALDRAGAHVADVAAKVESARRDLADAESHAAKGLRGADPSRQRATEEAIESLRTTLRTEEARLGADRARLAEYERQFEVHVEREELATLTHEACHALAIASGLCRDGQPTWLLEGVATLFEITSPRSFLLDAPNELRLDDLRAAWRPAPAAVPADGRHGAGAASRAPPEEGSSPGAAREGATAAAPSGPSRLADVVTDAGFLVPAGERGRAYAEAWSLVWHLSRRRPADLARLLRSARSAAFHPRSAGTRLDDFRAVFGDDLDAVEREWHDDVARVLGVRTP